MYNKPHAFENEIFEHYREQTKAINNAIILLKKHNYGIIKPKRN